MNGDAIKDQNAFVYLDCLIPSKKVQWRARYTVSGQWEASSEFSYGEFETLFVPPTDMIVPDIKESECAALNQGKEIPHFDKEIGYYDWDWDKDLVKEAE